MRKLLFVAVIALAGLVLCLMACAGMYLAFGRDLVQWPSSPSAGITRTPTPSPTGTPAPAPSTASAGETWIRPADGAVMAYVPAGEFLMGSPEDDPDAGDDEKPQRTVYLDAFWIDRTEVTNAQYGQCVESGACWEPRYWDDDSLHAPDEPVLWVSWHDAQSYAEWVGGRLPTEAEWEKAARGTDGRLYPWGDSPPACSQANFAGCAGSSLPVGSHPAGASPYGALEMAGNAQEWVADWYDADYDSPPVVRNPQGPESGTFRVLRGGSFLHDQSVSRCAHRVGGYPISRNGMAGFRVVVAPGEH